MPAEEKHKHVSRNNAVLLGTPTPQDWNCSLEKLSISIGKCVNESDNSSTCSKFVKTTSFYLSDLINQVIFSSSYPQVPSSPSHEISSTQFRCLHLTGFLDFGAPRFYLNPLDEADLSAHTSQLLLAHAEGHTGDRGGS